MVVCAVALGLLAPGSAAAAPTNGMIVYRSEPDEGEGEVRAVSPDGSVDLPLFSTPSRGGDKMKFSPDGNAFLYRRFAAGATFPDLWVATLDDAGERKVATGAGMGAWSPDSSRLVYTRYIKATNKMEFRTVNRDGTGDAPVSVEGYPCGEREFNIGVWWNQVTNRIMYFCGGGYQPALVAINPDGSDRQVVGQASDPSMDYPDLSPDGTTFVASSDENLIVYRWALGSVSYLTPQYDDRWDEWPQWSPDGARVVLQGGEFGRVGTIAAGGGAIVPVGAAAGQTLAWQPCVAGVTLTCRPKTLVTGEVTAQPTATPTPTATATPVATATPAATPVPAGPGPDEFRPSVALAKQAGDRLQFRVGCHASSPKPCAAAIEVRSTKAISTTGKKKSRLLVARGSATVAAGQSKTVKLKLSKATLKALRKLRKLPVTITATTTRADGTKLTASAKVTLKRPRK